MDRTPRRDLPAIPVRILVSLVFVLGVLGSLWGAKCSREKKIAPATYEEEVQAVFAKYQPLLRVRDDVEREEGVEAARRYYRQHIAEPMRRDMGEVRRRHGKPPLPQQ